MASPPAAESCALLFYTLGDVLLEAPYAALDAAQAAVDLTASRVTTSCCQPVTISRPSPSHPTFTAPWEQFAYWLDRLPRRPRCSRDLPGTPGDPSQPRRVGKRTLVPYSCLLRHVYSRTKAETVG
jgi:hypothetical protein